MAIKIYDQNDKGELQWSLDTNLQFIQSDRCFLKIKLLPYKLYVEAT